MKQMMTQPDGQSWSKTCVRILPDSYPLRVAQNKYMTHTLTVACTVGYGTCQHVFSIACSCFRVGTELSPRNMITHTPQSKREASALAAVILSVSATRFARSNPCSRPKGAPIGRHSLQCLLRRDGLGRAVLTRLQQGTGQAFARDRVATGGQFLAGRTIGWSGQCGVSIKVFVQDG